MDKAKLLSLRGSLGRKLGKVTQAKVRARKRRKRKKKEKKNAKNKKKEKKKNEGNEKKR